MEIQQLTTPKGINVWLAQSSAIPFISIEVSFRAGSAFDVVGKDGISNFTAALIDEGAGEMDAQAFQKAVEKIGARLWAESDKLDFSVNLDTLTEHTEAAFALLTTAVNHPRFDDEAVARIREVIVAGLKRVEEDPGKVAGRNFDTMLYGNHPYGHSGDGYIETINKITVADIKKFHAQNLTRNNMVVSVVGDISAKKLLPLVDKLIADLPEGKRNAITAAPQVPAAVEKRMVMDVPQSTVIMGHLGISRDHPSYYASTVMNYILGGGGFNSRFMEEVREKRGLAYGVSSYFEYLPFNGGWIASVATKNADVDKSIKVMRDEIARLIKDGITDEEYQGAIDYLSGSFPLRLDSNRKILNYLTMMQMEDLGDAYLDNWVAKIKAVTKQDVERAARELLNPAQLTTIVVGGKE